MKKLVLVVVVTLLLGACLPTSFTSNPGTQPAVDIRATVNAIMGTAVAQTLTSQPTATLAPLTDTPTPTAVLSEASLTPTETATALPAPNLTTTPVTATTVSGTTTAPVPSSRTLVPTLTVRLYGTLPPAVPFGTVTLINRARAEAYISLQVTTRRGGPTILEYPVVRTRQIEAPSGYYLYVAWVGGNKMIGNFSLHEGDSLYITLYKDRVVITATPSYP
jgi:hypothetical protein